jgi:hypothetical protein
MAYSYALLELNEALRAIKQEAATDPQIIHLNDALYAASEEIQNDLGRNVVKLSTKHWIEYHERSHSEPTLADPSGLGKPRDRRRLKPCLWGHDRFDVGHGLPDRQRGRSHFKDRAHFRRQRNDLAFRL